MGVTSGALWWDRGLKKTELKRLKKATDPSADHRDRAKTTGVRYSPCKACRAARRSWQKAAG